MIQYTRVDFNSVFAQQQADEYNDVIDWKVLIKYHNTNIMALAMRAIFDQARQNNQPPQPLPENDRKFSLDSGDKINAETINRYIRAHGQYTYLHGLKVLEDFFDKTVKIDDVKKQISKEAPPEPGQLNFTFFFMAYPLETTIIYFQRKFAEEIKNPFVSNAVFNAIQETSILQALAPAQ